MTRKEIKNCCLAGANGTLSKIAERKQLIHHLFKAHYAQMYRLAVSILYDEDESKDVVSEVFAVTLGAQKNIKLGDGITWTPQYNMSLMKPWLKSMFNGHEKSFSHPMLTLQLGNIIAMPHNWLLQADFNMHTHGNTGSNIWVDCTNPMLSLSVSKDFFKHRLNVKLTGNDLFNGGINRVMLYSNRMMFHKLEDNDSRCVQLSLRYRFNVTPSKYKGTGAGNAEKNRL